MKDYCRDTIKYCVKELGITERSATQVYYYYKGCFKEPNKDEEDYQQWLIMVRCAESIKDLYNKHVSSRYLKII